MIHFPPQRAGVGGVLILQLLRVVTSNRLEFSAAENVAAPGQGNWMKVEEDEDEEEHDKVPWTRDTGAVRTPMNGCAEWQQRPVHLAGSTAQCLPEKEVSWGG